MRCEVCGNNYDRAFVIRAEGIDHVFDSFECAIHALAPTCVHCGCRVLGHGVEQDNAIFCCDHCARNHAELADHSVRENEVCAVDITGQEQADAIVNEASEESFPASDAPAWSSESLGRPVSLNANRFVSPKT